MNNVFSTGFSSVELNNVISKLRGLKLSENSEEKFIFSAYKKVKNQPSLIQT